MVFGLSFLIAVLITPASFLALEVVILGTFLFFYFLFRDATNGLIIWLLSLLFTMFTKAPLGIDMPNLSLDRILYCFLVAYYFFHMARGKIYLSRRTTEILMFILCALGIFSIISIKGIPFSRGSLDRYSLLFNSYVVPFSAFIIAKDFINNEQKIHKLLIFLSFILLYLVMTSIFEHFKLNSLVFPRDIINPRMGIHFGRSRGPFLQSAVNGTVLSMLSVANLYMAINIRAPRKIFFVAIAILSPVAIFFTYTRAVWLAFLLSFVFMLFLNRKFRKYIALLVFFGSIMMVPLHSKIVDMERVTPRIYSLGPVHDRINLYYTYASMFKDKPFFGFGFGSFVYYSHEYFSKIKRSSLYNTAPPVIHDTFAGTIVELGSLGFLVFISILVSIFRKSFLVFRRLADEGFLGKGIVVIFWAMGIVYLFNASFIDMKYHQFQNVLFYLMAGVISGLHNRRLINGKTDK
ncbi:MAG: O-antigen ligase family protein [Candidatus Omnitrophica bacterium]|nr:O-antigen ligase family protein [Candidatus Omnitrophota bacterium]